MKIQKLIWPLIWYIEILTGEKVSFLILQNVQVKRCSADERAKNSLNTLIREWLTLKRSCNDLGAVHRPVIFVNVFKNTLTALALHFANFWAFRRCINWLLGKKCWPTGSRADLCLGFINFPLTTQYLNRPQNRINSIGKQTLKLTQDGL